MVAYENSGMRSYRRIKTSESNTVFIEPKGGIPFKEVELNYQLHGNSPRVTLYLPEDELDPNLNGHIAGYMASDEAYRETAASMASEGYPSFTVQPAHEQSRLSYLKNPNHITDPALYQSMAFHRAVGVALNYAGDRRINGIGHSYGGSILGHVAAFEDTLEYATFEASAAVDIENVPVNHITGLGGMTEEVKLILKKFSNKEARDKRPELMSRSLEHVKQLGRRGRELVYLMSSPDLSTNVQAAHEKGVVTSGLFHDLDRFFRSKRMQKALSKRSLFNVNHFSEGTYHVDPQLRPMENARLHIDMLEKMKAFKLAQKIEASRADRSRLA